MDRLWAGIGLAGALLSVSLLLSACAGREIREDVRLSGPPMWLEEAEGRRLVVMEAPNPGWRVVFDRSERAAGGVHRALLTIRRPDPSFFYPQQVAEQRVITDVGAGQAIEVYARIVAHDARKPGAPYDRVVLRRAGE